MTVTVALIAFAILFLAYSNGANDNFKGGRPCSAPAPEPTARRSSWPR